MPVLYIYKLNADCASFNGFWIYGSEKISTATFFCNGSPGFAPPVGLVGTCVVVVVVAEVAVVAIVLGLVLEGVAKVVVVSNQDGRARR